MRWSHWCKAFCRFSAFAHVSKALLSFWKMHRKFPDQTSHGKSDSSSRQFFEDSFSGCLWPLADHEFTALCLSPGQGAAHRTYQTRSYILVLIQPGCDIISSLFGHLMFPLFCFINYFLYFQFYGNNIVIKKLISLLWIKYSGHHL